MIVHLVDGTYELFRHFYGQRRYNGGQDKPHAAVIGVLNTLLEMFESGATHIGVATDHVIESFRNRLYSGYKTGVRHRAYAARTVSSSRGRHSGYGSGRLADDRA